MKKKLIIYESKTGNAKQYALWLQQALCCEIYPLSQLKNLNLSQYDVIIFGSWILGSQLQGWEKINPQLNQLVNKHICIFCVGMSLVNQNNLDAVINKNFTSEEKAKYKIFGLRGNLIIDKQNFFIKSCFKLFNFTLNNKLKKNKAIKPEEKEILTAISGDIKPLNRDDLKPIIAYLQTLT